MKHLIWIFILLFVVSCQDRQRTIMDILQGWEGRVIQYPDSMTFTIRGNDTVDFSVCGEYKILSYVDSTGCTSCKLGLNEWADYIYLLDSLVPSKVKFLFVFFPKDGPEIYQTLRASRFPYPICIDNDDVLNQLNHFPVDERFQTFLLDKSNKVLAIGNPIHNPKVKDLYLRIIQGKAMDTETPKPLTTISIDQTSLDMGTFDWQQEQTRTFTLTNTGDKLLAIEMVDTSCGCITVDYAKEPVRPGDCVTLRMTYKADRPEYFNKTLTVYCNAKEAPLRLTVKGNAE